MSDTTFALPPSAGSGVAASVAGSAGASRGSAASRSTPSRLDDATVRLVGRLAFAVDELGDAAGARFLASLAEDVPPTLSLDGDCLGLPTGGVTEPIDRLISALRPSPMELDLLVLAALAHHHEGVAAVLRSLHPDRRPWPTVGLAVRMAERGLLASAADGPPGAPGRVSPRAVRRAVRELLDEGSLVRAGALVVTGDGPHPDRTIQLAPGLWEALSGLDRWPGGCRVDNRPAPSSGFDGWLALPEVAAACSAVRAGAPVVVMLATDHPRALSGRLAALVAAGGRIPVVLHLPVVGGPTVRHVALVALVRGLVPVLWADDRSGEAVVLDPGDPLPVPILLVAPDGEVDAWPRPVLIVPGTPLDRADRSAAAIAAFGDDAVAGPVGPATVEPGDLVVAAADVRAAADHGRPADPGSVIAAVDLRSSRSVPPGATLVHPLATWDDLVLPDERLSQLREAVVRLDRAATVFDAWGFEHRRPGRHGVRLLFSGPPGTGKTLAAEIVAGELGRDLLVVDLSRLVSKWIGETEKNLAVIFEAAERGGAALFFDEADSLFGRRTEVGDARDRYANLETSYLLSRIERFDGVVFLATNLRQNLDPAFARRIEFIVGFEMPGPVERERLWRRHLPSAAPLAPSVDLHRLGALYDLPGALIRNAAVAAAFLAAGEQAELITTRHLVQAIRREYAKAGAAFPGPPAGMPGATQHHSQSTSRGAVPAKGGQPCP
jgi:hypothetical protein